MALPSWAPPEQDKPAPMPLLLVQSFINTRDIEKGTDQLLDDPGGAQAWLACAELIPAQTPVGAAQLREARAVREGLRALVRPNCDGTPPSPKDLDALRRVVSRRRPAVRVERSGRVVLAVGDATDLVDGLLEILLIVRDAQADGTWRRLKLCANSDCESAFFDRSRNRQGTWCSMAKCGNRLKNRRFRARGQQ